MFNEKTRSGYKRQRGRFKTLRVLIVIVLVFSVSFFIISGTKSSGRNNKKEILTVWNAGDFEKVYNFSKDSLVDKPMDYFLLTINGFSAFQIGISQINQNNTITFIDECIKSLRKALLHKRASNDARLCYVLGKAYYYKGSEYSDLAVKYLELSKELSYDAQDISEYLGLAYAACGDYRGSVEAFSQALLPSQTPSDTLLLSIARSYIALNEYKMAADYLQQCINISPDSKSIMAARLLLAEVLKISGDYDGAENLYISILDDTTENAEVHYQLGELYSVKGDTTRARSEWRLAYRKDPSHAQARTRLNI